MDEETRKSITLSAVYMLLLNDDFSSSEKANAELDLAVKLQKPVILLLLPGRVNTIPTQLLDYPSLETITIHDPPTETDFTKIKTTLRELAGWDPRTKTTITKSLY